jgi:hypothetical protein
MIMQVNISLLLQDSFDQFKPSSYSEASKSAYGELQCELR